MTKMIEVIHCGSVRVPELVEILKKLDVSFVVNALTELADRSTFDHALIVSGGPHLFTDSVQAPRLKQQFEFLRLVKTPILGICLGHQALGLAAGARIYRGEEVRKSESIGARRPQHPLWRGLPQQVDFVEDHCEGITLPADYELLAESRHYAVEAMVHRIHPWYGVQFHPESSGDMGERLIANYVKLAFTAMDSTAL